MTQIKTKPLPSRQPKYPFTALNVGQCFDVPAAKHESLDRLQSRVNVSMGYYAKKLGTRYTSQRNHQQNVVTIWRTA